MRKVFGVVVLLACVVLPLVLAGNIIVKNGELNVSDNFFVNTNNFFVNTTSGYIGIGTATPQNIFNVIGAGNFTGTIYSNGDEVLTSETDPIWTADKGDYSTTATILGWNYYNSTSFSIGDYYLKSNPFSFYNSTDFSIADYIPYTGATSNVDLGANNFLINNSVFFVNSTSGNIGIGTTAPGVKFDVLGTHVSGVGMARFKGDGAYGYMSLDTTTSGESGFLLSNAGTLTGQFGVIGDRVYIKNRVYGTDEIVSITSNGNVGIGTTSPQAALDVGTGKITGGTQSATYRNYIDLASATDAFPAVSTIFPGGTSGGVGVFKQAQVSIVGTNDIFFQAIPLTTAGYGYMESWNAAGMILGTGAPTPANAGPVILRPGRTEAMRVLVNGNVGIGTTSPDTKLQVAGDIHLQNDSDKLYLGQAKDVSMTMNGSSFNILNEVGSIALYFQSFLKYVFDGDVEVGGDVNVSGNLTATSYKKNCPAGYVAVPHDNLYTFEDFCVMKYEAKCAESATGACGNPGSYLPVSQTANTPWVSVYQYNARERCEAIGEGYHLITNAEWMTITTNIVKQSSNWQDGAVGTGCLYGGHMDNYPANALSSSTDDDSYSGTNDVSTNGFLCPFATTTTVGDATKGKEQRRIYYLSNGEVIWDISGNVVEWTDEIMNVGERPHVAASDYGWQEYSALNVFRSVRGYEVAMPRDNSFYNSSYGAGKIYTSQGTTGTQLCYSSITAGYTELNCAVSRGGDWGDGVGAGPFCARLNLAPSFSATSIGFRCSSS